MRLCEMDISTLADMLRNKQCSSVEILSDIHENIKDNKDINAYITVSEEAYKAALKADKLLSEGRASSLLTGIPVAVKDNISTKGLLTTCGSRMLGNFIPPFDATVIERLRNNGAIIIGKTNMDEFAMGSASDTSFYGAVRNPVNTLYSAGGSSGGSAAAVASGQAIAALGSDTGGSVRQPASFCGAVGFQPTYGSVSRYGLIAFASSLDQIGPITKNVTDAAIVYNAIRGKDERDATSVDTNEVKTESFPDFQGIRVGIPTELMSDSVSEEIRIAVSSAAKEMEKAGAVVSEVSIPALKYAVNAYYIISSAEASSNLARFDGVRFGFRAEHYTSIKDMYEQTRSEGFGLEVKRRILLGTFVLSAGYYDSYYKRAAYATDRLRSEVSELFNDTDIIISPVYPEAPFRLDSHRTPTEQYAADMCTVPANLTGCPAISLPFRLSETGMPIGIQLMADRFNEQKLFSAALCFEELTGGGR